MNSNNDDAALNVYSNAMLNYKIIGFTGSQKSIDALHCRIKGIPNLKVVNFKYGDVNMDNKINILNIILIVNYILVNVLDILSIVKLILNN